MEQIQAQSLLDILKLIDVELINKIKTLLDVVKIEDQGDTIIITCTVKKQEN